MRKFFKKRGISLRVINLWKGEELPLEPVAGIVSGGGVMGAYEEDQFPFLAAEKEWLRGHLKKGTPLLGICLGCQIFADAFGGKAFSSGTIESGPANLILTPEGKKDPVAKHLTLPVWESHGDTIDLPPDAVRLCETKFTQAFRLGSAFAVQFHPEAELEQLEEWLGFDKPKMEQLGMNFNEVLEGARKNIKTITAASEQFFDAWFSDLSSRSLIENKNKNSEHIGNGKEDHYKNGTEVRNGKDHDNIGNQETVDEQENSETNNNLHNNS